MQIGCCEDALGTQNKQVEKLASIFVLTCAYFTLTLIKKAIAQQNNTHNRYRVFALHPIIIRIDKI